MPHAKNGDYTRRGCAHIRNGMQDYRENIFFKPYLSLADVLWLFASVNVCRQRNVKAKKTGY